jgi:tetratricopeptide (TPR) repeat protein
MDSKEQDDVCANCGKAAVDDVKLKKCACNLVKYCSVACQKNHRQQHKKACKKRMAEIRDDRLFRPPDECYLGECPICCLPLSLDVNNNTINSCCCKYICLGCDYANKKRELEQGLEHKCAFCREPLPETEEKIDQNLMKRVKANDTFALHQMGGRCGDKGDYEEAFQYYTKAAGLGDIEAHYNLSVAYHLGKGVAKDMKKKFYHLEEAAIGGHPVARFNLGCHEHSNGRTNRAAKHYIIAAKLGYDDALEVVKRGFQVGLVSKEDFEAALRGHQAAVDATKSEQREEAYAWFQQNGNKKRTEGGSR